MSNRAQHTIARTVTVDGIGFLTGADIRLRFLPACVNTGIHFHRADLPGSPLIPARHEFIVPRQRRTAIQRGRAVVEMVEHVMAALSALEVDNCVIQLDAPEPPGGDGSSQVFADALLHAGPVELDCPVKTLSVSHPVAVGDANQSIRGLPTGRGGLTIRYSLDYGAASPIVPQVHEVELTPATFLNEIVFARTFVLEQEAVALRAQGYGCRATAKDLLVFSPQGVVDNELRTANECARHKLLDCIGDFALSGHCLEGRVEAHRSGHNLNAEFVQRLMSTHDAGILRSRHKAA